MTKDGKWKILVTEKVGGSGLELFRKAKDVELTEVYGLAREGLKAILGEGIDGILTRSGTTMDKEIIDSASSLAVIARAGVGVDNIDIAEASRRGITVINAPSGNTIAAAELTMACMLSVVRKLPQACLSLHRGEWDRNRFTGCQLNGKRLLVIGLGRIGSAVAKRCRAFGMEITAYDPYITKKRAELAGADLADNLEDALSMADVITIHTPLTEETANMINEDMLRVIKQGAYLINCARGGIVNEKAVVEALRSGRLKGFGTDVYSSEPLVKGHPFLDEEIEDKITITPHIGANTVEAQSEVSRIAAENMLAVLRGEPYSHAVNLPFIEQTLNAKQKTFLNLSRKMGIIGGKIAEVKGCAVHKCKVILRGKVFEEDENANTSRHRPYTVALLKGLLEVSLGESVTYMIAPLLAKDRHIEIFEGTGEPQTYKNTIEAEFETEKDPVKLTGTITEEGRMRIVNVNGFWVDFVPKGRLILFQNHDRPGVIGKLGNILGESKVNIANFALGRKEGSGLAFGALSIDGDLDESVKMDMEKSGDMLWLSLIDLEGKE